MPWQAEREVAQRAFDKKDLRQLRHILAAQRELFDDEVTEIDPEDKPVWDPSPRLFSSRLRETTKLYGIAIPPDSETFYTDSGRLSSVSLGDDTEIYGSCYPTDSIVYFLKDGGLDWVSLSTDTWVKTGRKRSSRLLARKLISFYRNGTFKETTSTARREHRPLLQHGPTGLGATRPLHRDPLRQATSGHEFLPGISSQWSGEILDLGRRDDDS